MSSPSEGFECHWRASPRLALLYLGVQMAVWLALALVDLPGWVRLTGLAFCGLHGAWVLPRHILLSSPSAFRGLRCGIEGWSIRDATGWRPLHLCVDSLALPWVIVLRFRLVGERRVRSLCLPCDALDREMHRRLRVRLKFSRRRWAAAG